MRSIYIIKPLHAYSTQLAAILSFFFFHNLLFRSTVSDFLSRKINETEWWSCGSFCTEMNRVSSIWAARAYQEAERGRSYICMHYSNRAIGYGASLLSGVARTTWRSGVFIIQVSLWIIKPYVHMSTFNQDRVILTVERASSQFKWSCLLWHMIQCFLYQSVVIVY